MIGVVSGYFSGRFDFFVQRFIDILLSFPIIVLAVVVVAMLGRNIVIGINVNLIVAIAIPIIPKVARVVRSSALSVREFRISMQRMPPDTLTRGLFSGTWSTYSAVHCHVRCICRTGNSSRSVAVFSLLGVTEPTPAWA